ncbi:MAG: Gx transporter family protein [Ectothiorhodospiraceae bacterium]
MHTTIQSSREDLRIAYLTALAIGVHVAESALPSPIPGVKPGLANVITVAALCRYGWKTAAWVALLRALAGSLILGTFLSPTFMLSISGAAATVATLGLSSRIPGIGPVGHSLLAAMSHIAAQFFVAWALFIPHPGLLHLLPVFMTAAVIFGTLNGLIAQGMLRRLDRGIAPGIRAEEAHG